MVRASSLLNLMHLCVFSQAVKAIFFGPQAASRDSDGRPNEGSKGGQADIQKMESITPMAIAWCAALVSFFNSAYSVLTVLYLGAI